MTKPGFEYIDFVQPVQASQKNINKFNELENFLTTGGFIQACNLPMATKRRCYSVNHGGERWDNFRQRHAPAPPNCSASDRTHQSGDSGMTNTTTEATDSARELVFMRVSGVFIGHIYHHICLCESDHMKRYDAIKG